MTKKSKDYFGLNRIISIILAVIPVTSWILGTITRFKEKKVIAGLIRLLFGFTFVWIVDLILIIMEGRIWRLIDC